MTYAAATTLDDFRATARSNLRTPGDFVLVNYQRAALGQGEIGHISPLAAYNAGAERVRAWLSGASGLPLETVNYVQFVTGRAAEEWKLDETDLPEALKTAGAEVLASCRPLAPLVVRAELRGGGATAGGRSGRRRGRDRRPAPWERPGWSGTKPTPTGRRRSAIPVIEIARAARTEDALAGLEPWKARHPEAARHLETADILVDAMRGRSTTWTRIRVNLIHVPPEARPRQEPLDPDYDPWAAYEWPDQSGQLERAPRRSDRPDASSPSPASDADAGGDAGESVGS